MNELKTGNATAQPENEKKILNSFETPDWYLKGYAANIRVRAETVQTFLGDSGCDRVLDIGCGDGSLSLPLVGRARHITFLDRSAAMLDRVKSRLPSPTTATFGFVQSDFLEAKFAQAEFDLVLGVGVLAYVKDVNEFMAKVRYCLKPGGLAIVECTNTAHFVTKMDDAYKALAALVKPRKFKTFDHSAGEVMTAAEGNRLRFEHDFRYCFSFPVLSKIVPYSAHEPIMRRLFGTARQSRMGWLGNQRLFSFRAVT